MSKGSFVHGETAVRHRTGTTGFLAEMFGWDDVPHFTDPPIGQRANGSSERVLLYVGSDDIETDLKKAQGLGATIIAAKTEVTGSGWYAIIDDPHGSRIALWS